MTLVVEDGSGDPLAESYNSLEEIATYAAAHGLTFVVGSPEDAAEAAARRATTYIDGIYRNRFPGTRTNGRGQALQWPRTDAEDVDGEEIEDDEVPAEIKAAHCEVAIRELASPGSLSPDYVAATQVAREKVGPIEVEYREAYGGESVRPCVQIVEDILAGLLGRRTQILFGETGRS